MSTLQIIFVVLIIIGITHQVATNLFGTMTTCLLTHQKNNVHLEVNATHATSLVIIQVTVSLIKKYYRVSNTLKIITLEQAKPVGCIT